MVLAAYLHDVGKAHPKVAPLVASPNCFPPESEEKRTIGLHGPYGSELVERFVEAWELEINSDISRAVDIVRYTQERHHHSEFSAAIIQDDKFAFQVLNVTKFADYVQALYDETRPYEIKSRRPGHEDDDPRGSGLSIMAEIMNENRNTVVSYFGAHSMEVVSLFASIELARLAQQSSGEAGEQRRFGAAA